MHPLAGPYGYRAKDAADPDQLYCQTTGLGGGVVARFLSLFMRILSITVKLNIWLETPFLQNPL